MKNLLSVEEGFPPPQRDIPVLLFENNVDVEGEKNIRYLKEMRVLRINLKKGLTESFIAEFHLFSSVSKDNLLPIPKSLNGVDVDKYTVYLEGEMWDKIKLTIRKILHFFFGVSKSTKEYLEKEIDKNDKLRKELLQIKKRMADHSSRVKKLELLTKIVSTWDYHEFAPRLNALRNIYDVIERSSFKNVNVDKKDLDIDTHFINELKILNIDYDKEKNVLVAMDKNESLIKKDTVGDLNWDFEKIKVALDDTLRLYERRKVFDNLIEKLDNLDKLANKINSNVNSNNIDPNNLKQPAEKLHDEIRFINKLKDIILGYNHRIIFQIFILCKVSLNS